jgi:hypothetical protein
MFATRYQGHDFAREGESRRSRNPSYAAFASNMQYERRDGRNRLTLRFVETQTSSQQPG